MYIFAHMALYEDKTKNLLAEGQGLFNRNTKLHERLKGFFL